MAEDLDDGEFWLPSHFLTDDDILMDFDFEPLKSSPVISSGSISDLDFTSGSTETESDEEDILLAGLTRKIALQDSSCPVHSKGTVLSSSPQSTLFGCLCQQSSSRESQSGPVSPPQPQLPPQDKENNNNNKNATLDLLNKAAGEVARLKLKTEKSTGTGFFDCSQKGVLYPSPIRNPDPFPPLFYQPQFHHFSPMVWAPQYNQPPKQQPQNRATKNNKNNNNNKSNNNNSSTNRPLGLPPSAWPPLQAQVAQAQAQVAQNQAPVMAAAPIFVGPKRECVGTGVFLPRRVTTPTETRKKFDGNSTKTKSGKGSQSQSNHRRNSRPTSTGKPNDIQLPQEWTY